MPCVVCSCRLSFVGTIGGFLFCRKHYFIRSAFLTNYFRVLVIEQVKISYNLRCCRDRRAAVLATCEKSRVRIYLNFCCYFAVIISLLNNNHCVHFPFCCGLSLVFRFHLSGFLCPKAAVVFFNPLLVVFSPLALISPPCLDEFTLLGRNAAQIGFLNAHFFTTFCKLLFLFS